MNVDVIIATYGSDEWKQSGHDAYDCTRLEHELDLGDYGAVHRQHADNLHSARNLGAQRGRAEWLCFLDADDELEPGYFDAMRQAVAMTTVMNLPALLVPAVRYVHANGEADAPGIPNTKPRRPLCDINTAVIGTLVQRSMFKEVGGFRDWPCYEDWDLWLRCVQAGAELVEVPAAVYRAHVAPRGTGRNLPARRVRERTYHAIRKDLGYE